MATQPSCSTLAGTLRYGDTTAVGMACPGSVWSAPRGVSGVSYVVRCKINMTVQLGPGSAEAALATVPLLSRLYLLIWAPETCRNACRTVLCRRLRSTEYGVAISPIYQLGTDMAGADLLLTVLFVARPCAAHGGIHSKPPQAKQALVTISTYVPMYVLRTQHDHTICKSARHLSCS